MNERQIRTEEERLAKRLGRLAKDEWTKGRHEKNIIKFTDKRALRDVAEYAALCYRKYSAEDILKAVRELSREPRGLPWQIPDTAQRLSVMREDLEHLARKMEEKKPMTVQMPSLRMDRK